MTEIAVRPLGRMALLGLLVAFCIAIVGEASGAPAPAPRADVRLSVQAAPASVRLDRQAAYVLAVRNAGPGVARGTRVSLTVSGGATIVSAAATAGTCVASGGARLACSLGNRPAGSRNTIRVQLRATSVGPATVAARVTSVTRDPRSVDNAVRSAIRVRGDDAVQGRGTRRVFQSSTLVEVEIDATSGPEGEEATGTFSIRYVYSPPLEFRGRIVCLTVKGTKAAVTGIVESSNDPQRPPGHGIRLQFTDNSSSGAGRDTQISFLDLEPPDASVCPGQPAVAELEVIEGDFVVRDS